MPKQFISEELLVEEALRIAETEGLSRLSVRKLAAACNMSVGSLYSYFPTKADLVKALVTKSFSELFFDDFCQVRENERFITYLRRLYGSMKNAFSLRHPSFLREMGKLSEEEREAGEKAHRDLERHMLSGLRAVLYADLEVQRDRLVGPLSEDALCKFTLETMMSSLRENRDCEALFVLLENTLYDQKENE